MQIYSSQQIPGKSFLSAHEGRSPESAGARRMEVFKVFSLKENFH